MREIADLIVVRDDPHAIMRPAIVAIGHLLGERGQRVAPPRRWLDGHGVELEHAAGDSLSAAGHVEFDRGLPVDVVDREAALVELQAKERVGGATILGWVRGALRENGITRRFVGLPAVVRQRARVRRTEQVGDGCLASAAKVDDASARRVPGAAARQVDVEMVFVRDIGTIHAEDVDLRRGGGGRVGVDVVVRADRILIGMRTRVVRRDARDRGIREEHRAVARRDVSPIETLPEEERVRVGEVVVRGIELVEMAAEAREVERRAAHVNLAVVRRHPERRVCAAEQELRPRRNVARRSAGLAGGERRTGGSGEKAAHG